MQGVFVKNYADLPCDEQEILRYAGWRGSSNQTVLEDVRLCFAELKNALAYRVCYVVTDVTELKTLFGKTEESWLDARLSDAKKVVLFCATAGIEIDRFIQRYAHVSPTKALWFQALGAERIESLCNRFCEDIKKEFLPLKAGARFSPGYGNVPLEIQSRVLEVLDTPRKIGVSLNDSLLMSPSKSVTAFIPLLEEDVNTFGGCAVCGKRDCALRKE